MEGLYTYKAKVIAAYDGDTITVLIDLGFKITITHKVRLSGINAPEMRLKERPRGILSRDYLRGLVLNENVHIVTDRDRTGKYGRYIAKVYFQGSEGLICLNDHMVISGHAVYKEY